jgi:hypothetical protein
MPVNPKSRISAPPICGAKALGLTVPPGCRIELVDIPGAGHFDLVTPGTRAWEEVRARIAAALGAAR